MNPLRVFMRGWSYNLKRSTRLLMRRQQSIMAALIRQKVPAFDRRRKA